MTGEKLPDSLDSIHQCYEDEAKGVIAWYDVCINAREWWNMPDLLPREAAMLLCRLNPFDNADDPETTFVDNDNSSPRRYEVLLRTFESVARNNKVHRTLMQWHAIAQERKLPYHPWIDEYERAMLQIDPQPAPVPKVEARTTQKRQRQDALAVELDEILTSLEERTPAKVMAMLRGKIGKPNTCILSNVGDGIKWENDRGEIKTLTISNLGERIREWKKTGLSQG